MSIYYELYYHIVWSTKNREVFVTDDIQKALKILVPQKIKKLGGESLEFNTYEEHCHLLTKIPPLISISDFVGQTKGYCSYEINKIRNDSYLKWQHGFGVLSLSKKGVPFIKRYIQNQKQHHQSNSTISVLEYIPSPDRKQSG